MGRAKAPNNTTATSIDAGTQRADAPNISAALAALAAADLEGRRRRAFTSRRPWDVDAPARRRAARRAAAGAGETGEAGEAGEAAPSAADAQVLP